MASTAVSLGFSIKEKKALVTIFTEDIKNALRNVLFSAVLQNFEGCFDNSEMKTIMNATTANGDEAGKVEIYKYAAKAHDPRVFVQLIQVVEKYDPLLAEKLKCIGAYDPSHYQQILASYQHINLFLSDKEFAELTTACTLNGLFTSDIRAAIEHLLKPSDGATANRRPLAVAVFLKNLPRHHPEWYWLFMEALTSITNGLQLRNVLNENFEKDFEQYRFEKRCVKPELWNKVDSNAVRTEWLNNRRRISNENAASAAGAAGSSASSPDTSTIAGPLKLRNYQLDLAEAAISGQNAVICAPTGSGKTYVAAEIIRNHFANNKISRSAKKVAFLVPTTQLVDQQYEVMKSNLDSTLRIKRMMGGSTGSSTSAIPKVEGVASNDVIVTTPQVLINIFADTTATTPITFSSFSLLVLDECHHTDKQHPYNEIMNRYLDIKIGNPCGAVGLPQVVCLTASLGVGKADDEQKALEHVVHKLANMDAQALSTVSDDHRTELADFVNVPTDRVVHVNHPQHPLSSLIEGIMGKIEALVAADFKLLKQDVDPLYGNGLPKEVALLAPKIPVTVAPPARRSSPNYTGWVGTWLAKFPEFKESPAKPAITSAFEHLRVYHIALDLNAHVPVDQAFRYLRERFEEFERKQSSDRDRDLVRIYQQDLVAKLKATPHIYAAKNALVERLTEILLKEFQEKDDARVLIFVRTRDLTSALEEYMKDEPRLKRFNAARLTGAQAAKEKGGQTTKEQQDLLERFRNGFHRILIATTVAEEGLDVEKCHLVVKYNHVTNEIAMVQRRGRGRAAGSESILLYQDEWIEEKEAVNTLRESLMLNSVTCLRAKGDVWLRSKIAAEQMKEYKDRMLEKQLLEKKRRECAGKAYDMLCKKCDVFIASTTSIRLAGPHYISADPTIWSRLSAEPANLPMLYETMVMAGKVSCKKCRNDCGIVIRIKNTYLPGLKIAAFSLRNAVGPKDGPRLVKKKWSKATDYFNVDELADSDLREMFEALDPSSRTKLDDRIRFAETVSVVMADEQDTD